MIERADIFEDIAVALQSWAATASKAITDNRTDLNWVEDEVPYRRLQQVLGTTDEGFVRDVLSECLRGFAVSILSVLDGATASAEKGRVYLIDESGRKVGEALHSDFVGYLMDTGRLK
jgi:hypothetical protein